MIEDEALAEAWGVELEGEAAEPGKAEPARVLNQAEIDSFVGV